jgi:soluble cytochrome b562
MGISTTMRNRLIFLPVLLIGSLALAEPPAPPEDNRVLVEMPELQRELLREEMQGILVALNRIIGHLAEGDLSAASEAAESAMGVSTMGKHAAATRGLGGPGRFMPDEMRQMGFGLHEAASRFAKVAQDGDPAETMRALQGLTATCLTCHMAYRTR